MGWPTLCVARAAVCVFHNRAMWRTLVWFAVATVHGIRSTSKRYPERRRNRFVVEGTADCLASGICYRPEIDGLRAVSVLLVIGFHFELTPVPGGFVGVDVFFVISGYLITAIILREIEAGTFSVARFWERRIRRILPALLTMMVAVLVGGVFLLMPGDYVMTARSAVRAAMSVSNIFFLKNVGYFHPAAELQPLLHTWSLGVEEQFYFVWPMALLAIFFVTRGNRQLIAAICVMILLGSFAWSAHLVATHPPRAFYLAPSRGWELGVGALLAIAPATWFCRGRLVIQALSLTGLGLIVASALIFSKEEAPFPGFNALPVVLGAALVIAPWSAANVVRSRLSHPVLVLVGKMSFSLYLWHWPLLVFYRHYAFGEGPSFVVQIGLLVGTFVISWFSWRFVENSCTSVKAWPARQHRYWIEHSNGRGGRGHAGRAGGWPSGSAHAPSERADRYVAMDLPSVRIRPRRLANKALCSRRPMAYRHITWRPVGR